MRLGNHDFAWRALLKQELAGLNHRFAVEPRAHLTVMQNVSDGDNRHALVMRHEVVNNREVLVVRQSRAGEIECFVEAVPPARPQSRKACVVSLRSVRIDHGREAGRVGRNHEIFGKPALQAKPRNSKIGVLVREFEIARVVGAFSKYPRERPVPTHRTSAD